MVTLLVILGALLLGVVGFDLGYSVGYRRGWVNHRYYYPHGGG